MSPPGSNSTVVRTAWRATGAVVTVVLLLLAAAVAWTLVGTRHHDDRHFHHQGSPARVAVRTGDGDVTISPSGGDAVTVDSRLTWSSLRKPGASATMDGDTLQITGTCPGSGMKLGLGRTCAVDFVVHVPPAVTVDVSTEGGDVHATGLTGTVTLTTTAGEVVATDIAGTLSLRSDAGTIRGSGLRGPAVTARLDSGDLTLAFAAAPASVNAMASAGDVDIALTPGSYKVQAHSNDASPEISVTDDPTAASAISAQSDAGSVRIHYLN